MRKPKIKIHYGRLTDAERAAIEDIGQPWSAPEGMKRAPDGSLWAPMPNLTAWRTQHTSPGQQP